MRFPHLLLLPVILLAQSDPLMEQAHQAKQAMATGRFREAAAIYEKLAQILPENAGLRMNVGLALHSAGDYDGAAVNLKTAVKLDPSLAPAWLLLGIGYQKRGQPQHAIVPLEKAVALEPQNRTARLELADACISTGKFERAAAEFRQLVAVDARFAKGWQGLGLCYSSLSRRAFHALEETTPESAYWYDLLARSRIEQQQYRSAFGLFRKALQKDPLLRGVHQGLAEVYERTGHPDWARVESQKERELPALKCRAATLECAFSRADFARVIAAKSADPAAHYWQARSYSMLAYEAFSKLAELPEGPEIHEVRAEGHQLAGRHADAVQEWRAAVRLAPGDGRVQEGLARALVTARDYEAARPLLERLLTQNRTSVDLNLQLGRVLVEQQRGEEALPHLRIAAGRLEARALLGRSLLQLGRPAEAIPHLVAALPDDNDGSLHYQLAMAYRRTGDEQRANWAIREQEKIIGRTKNTRAEIEITPP